MDIIYYISLVLHIFGTVLGAGGATITDILFFKFMKDGKIDRDEFDILQTISKVIWVGFLLLFLSGFYLAWRKWGVLEESPKFWMKMIIVFIIFLNGLTIHYVVIGFLKKHLCQSLRHPRLKPHLFSMLTCGGISLISWYCAILLGVLRNSPLTFWGFVLLYSALLTISLVISHTVGKQLFIKPSKKESC